MTEKKTTTTECIDPSSTIHQRMFTAMAMIDRIVKDRENQHHRYKYIGHDDVTAALRGAFLYCRILQKVTMVDCQRLENGAVGCKVSIEWINIDNADQVVQVESYGESGGEGGKGKTFVPHPQQVGIALSYAVKSAQLKNFCLVGDDTPDPEYLDDAPREPVRQREMPAAPKTAPSTKPEPKPEPEPPPADDDEEPLDDSDIIPNEDRPASTFFERMHTAFGAVSSMKSWQACIGQVKKSIKDLTAEERKELERAALKAKRRLESAQENGVAP